jgi:flagella basal body P-ring formation protein FlgA
MISTAPLVYIEYKTLSNDEGVAEIQKDIIVQLIKLNKQEDTIVIENLPEQEKAHKDYILSAKCLQCKVLDNSQSEIITSSIKKSTNNFSTEITFDLINSSEKKVTWKVEFTEKKIIYYIAAKQNINPNTILSIKDLEIVSCTTAETKCSPKNSYLNSKDALNQLNIYGNKKTLNSIRMGQEVDPKWLSQEILIRSGEKIKVTYSPNNSLTVETFGKSLSNGGRGEIIRVQISDWFDKGTASRPTGIIEGTVIAPGEVEYAAN